MDRYDRQNYTYGKSATKNLFNSSVLLLGSRNHLLTEIAKNLLMKCFIFLQTTQHRLVLLS